MGHGHGESVRRSSRAVRLVLFAAVVPFVVATMIGLVVLWPRHSKLEPAVGLDAPVELIDATVRSVTRTPCPGGGLVCQTADVLLTSGAHKDESAAIRDAPVGSGIPALHQGDRIVVGRSQDPTTGRVDIYFADYQRKQSLALLAAVFAVFVVAVARWRGFASLVGLGFTFGVLVRFMLPAILDGRSAIAVALVGSSSIMLVVLYLAHGFNARTTTALLGTLTSLGVTGVLAVVFVGATHLSGQGSEEASYLQTAVGTLNLQGLILGGTIIGSLGVLNDVTVTQSSSVWELHHGNPGRGGRSLYRSAMRIGRDHIASTVYTLVLAYAGASLPLLVLFTVVNRRLSDVITSEVVAVELVRTLVGLIGLVLAIPITTALAAMVVSRTDVDAAGHDEQHEGWAAAGGARRPGRRSLGRRMPAWTKRPRGADEWTPPAAEREWRE